MKERKTKIILYLVVLSTISIMILQVFWLTNSYKLQLEKQKGIIYTLVQESLQQERILSLVMSTNFSKEQASDIEKSLGGLMNNINPQNITLSYVDSIGSTQDNVGKILTDTLFESKIITLQNGKKNTLIQKTNFKGVDPPVQQKKIDSILTAKFEELKIPNRFEVQVVRLDSIKNIQKDSITLANAYINYSTPLPPYNFVNIEVYPHFLQGLSEIKGILVISILILGLLLYGLIQLIELFRREKKMSEIKNDFISNMTHEFKTPIATVSLAIESIRNFGVQKDPARLEEYLEICDQELKRVSKMIQSVLRMSQEKPYVIQTESLDLEEMLQKFALAVKPKITAQNGQLHIQHQQSLPAIELDAVHIENIFHNLLDNSLKYCSSTPQIYIRTQRKDQGVLIEFEDNGIGIPSAYLDRIFDQFFRVPTGNTHTYKGFGLGLSYVKKIVDLHQGKISVQSKVDKGTTISIYLPIKQTSHDTH
jgi:two-component system phosphate regulon sensor histidine kinase PhoR